MKRAWILLLVLSVLSCNKGGLTMSYSSADISTTEDEHVVLAGFAARDGLSDGIHQHLYTHCLVLGDGTQKVCIISNDLMEISPAISDTIRTMIAEQSGLALDNIKILIQSIAKFNDNIDDENEREQICIRIEGLEESTRGDCA